MSRANQVREVSGIRKVIEAIKLMMEPLTMSDKVNTENVEGLKEIEEATNTSAISELEEKVSSVYIPLDDKKDFVQKETVSIQKAQQRAKEIREQKDNIEKQIQRED